MALLNKSSMVALGVTTLGLILSSTLLVHDSTAINQTLSDQEMHEIVDARPALYDLSGKPMKVTENDYQRVLTQGVYQVKKGAQIAMITPQNQVAVIDATQAPLALLKGWNVESTDHAYTRYIHDKQLGSMWLPESEDLWFQYALFGIAAILYFGALALVRESN